MTLTFVFNSSQTDVTKQLLFKIILYILVTYFMERNKERTTVRAPVVGDGEKCIFRIRSIDLCGLYPKQILVPQMVPVTLIEFLVLSGCI